MARNVTVTWVLPTTRASGKPLAIADIAGVELSLSADGVNYSVYDTFTPDVLTTVIPELEIGEWFVSGIVKDTTGKVSPAVVSSIVVPDETPPGALLALNLTL